jgi:hypothetical protein
MGYYIEMSEADFTIPEREDVLNAIRQIPVKYKALANYGGQGFGWLSTEEIENAESVQALFESAGFECVNYGNKTFGLNTYYNKTAREDLLLAVVAPFVEHGSFTEWRGEDGEVYRFTVYRGKLTVQTPREIVWHDHERLIIDGVNPYEEASHV